MSFFFNKDLPMSIHIPPYHYYWYDGIIIYTICIQSSLLLLLYTAGPGESCLCPSGLDRITYRWHGRQGFQVFTVS